LDNFDYWFGGSLLGDFATELVADDSDIITVKSQDPNSKKQTKIFYL